MTTTTPPTSNDERVGTMPSEFETLREAQLFLTAAIAHAREEALEPAWSDKLLGLRLRLEKTTVTMIAQRLDQIER
jgi:hypothetical protein